MTRFDPRSSTLPRLLLPLIAGMFALTLLHSTPQAAEIKPVKAVAYVMPADDGYGVTECIARGGACARIVADAWCEAHGHAQAISFGPAEDVTGGIADNVAEKPAAVEPGSYIVTCGE